MKINNFLKLRFLINFIFVSIMVIILIFTLTEKEYDREDIMLLLLYREGIVLILQAITNQAIGAIPILNEVPPQRRDDNRNQ